ncbi:hypothetical protein [Curtobacterium sp. VKM Ac-2922]|uniref:hypothetical protein n=1 Tax=Curtobacterium sp. VKM Ac-2922 TaxID=2929475 RepID=UPI001FB4B38B|nr:hypothetical protein [Curtobacterium sp. VKM Ac-2922]MCJ1715401.1 hypothetical protein [Curtobacterium sp. VKM Ac-2922]
MMLAVPDQLYLIARRARRRTVPIALAGLAVGAVSGAFVAVGQPPLVALLTVAGFGASGGGLAGTFSLLPTTTQLAPDVRLPVAGLDKDSRRTLRNAVMSGRPIPSADPETAARGLHLAQLTAVYLPLALAQFLLLYVGIGGAQIPSLVAPDGSNAGLTRVVLIGLLLVAIVMTIVFTRQIRGARRYLAAANR